MFSWAFVKEIRLATRACVVDVGNFLKVGPSVKRKTVLSKNNNIFCFHDLMISTFLFFHLNLVDHYFYDILMKNIGILASLTLDVKLKLLDHSKWEKIMRIYNMNQTGSRF